MWLLAGGTGDAPDAAFVLWAAVALSPAASGQTLLTPGVAAQGHIDQQARALFAFYDSPGDAALIRLLSLSQDPSIQFIVTWNYGYPTTLTPPPIIPRSYSVPGSDHRLSGPGPRLRARPASPSVESTIFLANSQGYYTITVYSQNGTRGDFLLVYTSLKGNCPSSNPSCGVVCL